MSAPIVLSAELFEGVNEQLEELDIYASSYIINLALQGNLDKPRCVVKAGTFDKLIMLKRLHFVHADLEKDCGQLPVSVEEFTLNLARFTPRSAIWHCLSSVAPNLRKLSLSNNVISELTPATLADFVNLEQLDLSCNEIVEILPDTFHRLGKLRELSLANNSLKSIKSDAFRGKKKSIDISRSLTLNFLILYMCKVWRRA